MILSIELLASLLAAEFILRLVLEIRERRATQVRGGIFAMRTCGTVYSETSRRFRC